VKKPFNREKFKYLLPYYLLALSIIITVAIVLEISFFFSFIGQVRSILTPFFYGFMIAYIVNIPCSAIQKLLAKSNNKFILKKQRLLSVLSVILIFLTIIALILNWIIPAIRNSIVLFVENVPTYWESILWLINEFNELELFGLQISPENVFAWFGDMFSGFSIDNLMSPIGVIVDVGSAMFTGVIAIISSIYVLMEKDKFKSFLSRFIRVYTNTKVSGAIIGYAGRLNENFREYVRMQTIDGMILGTLATIQLLIIRSPFALLLGLILGIFNYVPYFGSIFATLIAIIVVALTQGIGMGAIIALTLLITQQIDANIIQPRLMSGSFKLSPLLVIISITVGGAIAGILGMIAAIPIVAVLKEMYDSITDYYEYKKFGEVSTKDGNG